MTKARHTRGRAAGVDPRIIVGNRTGFHRKGLTDLHRAAATGDLGEIKAILSADPSRVDEPDKYGLRPLHFAAVHGGLAAIGVLTDFNADVNAPDKDGATPLHLAAQHGKRDAASYLLCKGASKGHKDSDGRTPLDVAQAVGGVLQMRVINLLEPRDHGRSR